MDGEYKSKKIDDLRTIVEKVEEKAHVTADHPDIVVLQKIVNNKLAKIEGDDAEASIRRA